MTHIKLHALLADAQDCNDLDEYIAECGGSVPTENAENAITLLTELWQFRDGIDFPLLLGFSGMYLAEFARIYGIPLRTVENWDAGTRKPPSYLLELLLCDVLNTEET